MPKIPKGFDTYIGVDPGQTGGLCAITVYPGSVKPKICMSEMPATEMDIWNWFKGFDQYLSYAIIEKVHSMPQQGVSSTFKFGKGYGFLRACLIGNGIPFEEATPQAWMKALGVPRRKKGTPKSQGKNQLKAMAQQLFPQENVTLATADACLIATYCQRKHEGKLG